MAAPTRKWRIDVAACRRVTLYSTVTVMWRQSNSCCAAHVCVCWVKHVTPCEVTLQQEWSVARRDAENAGPFTPRPTATHGMSPSTTQLHPSPLHPKSRHLAPHSASTLLTSSDTTTIRACRCACYAALPVPLAACLQRVESRRCWIHPDKDPCHLHRLG